jgi:mannan endo-1,4-beta-mannosidase
MLSVLVAIAVSVATSPCTSNPTAAATKMYNFLVSKYTKKMIAGVMTTQGQVQDNFAELNWVKSAAGKFPALGGWDFLHMTGKNTEWYTGNANLKTQVTDSALAWYKRGGLPILCWHWRDPSKQTIAFYSPTGSGGEKTTFDCAKAVISGTAENKAVMTDLAFIGDQLKILKDAGIAVLWRPLHEASGKWFWWGYAGPEPFKKLWKIEFDYFVKTRGLNNMIWVFTADQNPTAGDWYPGDDMVDCIGVDIYEEGKEHPVEDAAWNSLKKIFGDKKILCYSECGHAPDPDQAQKLAPWSWFMTWYGHYTQGGYNTAAWWKTALANSFIITLDQMPGW